MYLIVGLGNPGAAYDGTRHNIGRSVLEAAAKSFALDPFERNRALSALVTQGKVGKNRVIFLLPETFVNRSGNAVGPALRRWRIRPERLVVIHDDADLMLGATKLSFGRNSAGHKGIESVIRAVKTKKFWRMRLGIQKKRRIPGEKLVLQKFRGDESAVAAEVVKKSVDAVRVILESSPERAMNTYNYNR